MSETNDNSRLEAFCDGVFAIAITLLVIEIRIPATTEIHSTADFWHALQHIAPSIFAYFLSFIVILITWVNHHHHLKLVNKSCTSFLYANGFLLLTVAFLPFPTSLQGEYLFTDHASPAVILYNSVLAAQAIGWVLISRVSLNNQLGKSKKASQIIRKHGQYGYFAFALYALSAVTAVWFPLAVAIFTAVTWTFWLITGINTRHEEV